jgi:hypothetical protein
VLASCRLGPFGLSGDENIYYMDMLAHMVRLKPLLSGGPPHTHQGHRGDIDEGTSENESDSEAFHVSAIAMKPFGGSMVET